MTMTTINDITDLVRILKDHPEWRDTIRALIVGEELGNLPKNLDIFINNSNTNFNLVHQQLDKINQTLGTHDQKLDKLDADITTINQDTAQMRGEHARARTIANVRSIAAEMGLEYVRTLDETDLIYTARNADHSIPRRQIKSFTTADLVFEGSTNGQTHYGAIEISFTGTNSDAERATRNANFITQFTGSPATIGVASTRNDASLDFRIESGRLHWRQILEREAE